MVSVRLANRDDLSAMQHVEWLAGEPFRALGMDEVADDGPPSLDDLTGYLQVEQAWVAEESGLVVGYLLVDALADAAHIEQVSVAPTHARRGIGRQLIDTATDWADNTRLTRVTLTCFVNVPWNCPYYERLGFRVLPAEDRPPGLQELRDAEAQCGLDRWPRVAMHRSLH